MSKNAAPIPVQNNIVDGSPMSLVWLKYLQNMGNDWVTENRVKTISSFNYCIIGTILFYTFTSTKPEIIDLPYPLLTDGIIEDQIITAGTTKITLTKPQSSFIFIKV